MANVEAMKRVQLETELREAKEMIAGCELETDFRFQLLKAFVLQLFQQKMPLDELRKFLGQMESEAACGFPSLDKSDDLDLLAFRQLKGLLEVEKAYLLEAESGAGASYARMPPRSELSDRLKAVAELYERRRDFVSPGFEQALGRLLEGQKEGT